MKKWVILISMLIFYISFLAMHQFVLSDAPPEEANGDYETPNGEGFNYATIEYRDDLKEPDKYFFEVKAYPGRPFPQIRGGYAETNVHCFVKLRGVSVPRALQTADTRARPHAYIERERARHDKAMDYIWSLVKLNKTLRVYNPEVDADDCVECDVEFFLAGEWVNLAASMMHDEHARPINEDAEWDWGSRHVTLVNPAVPK